MFNRLSVNDIGASRLLSKQAQKQYIDMALSHYQKTLINSNAALRYLDKVRGIDMHIAKRYKIGFGNRSLGVILPDVEKFEGSMIRGALQRFGFIKPNGRELFWGYITIPIKNENGELVDIYGHRIAKYLKNGKTATQSLLVNPVSLFNAQCLGCFDSVILCSSPLEALSLISCGVENVVSITGFSSLCATQILQLKRNGVTHVTIGFANTPKAQRFRVIASKMFDAHAIQHSHLALPSGADINSVFVKAREMMLLCRQLGVTLPVETLCH